MASLSTLLVSICAIGAVNASPVSQRSYAVKERHIVPRAWTEVGPADKSESIHLQIGLRQSNEGAVERHLLEVSDPKHERYGQHLSTAEIHHLITPAKESVDSVKSWLLEHEIFEHYFNPSKDWVEILIPIEKAEKLLDTSYSVFEHEDGAQVTRAPVWSLPAHLHEHIDVVQPTTSFFRPAREVKTYGGVVAGDETWTMDEFESLKKTFGHSMTAESSDASIAALCNVTFTTPDCIRTLYGTINYTPQAADKNGIGICNYLNETCDRSDTRKYLKNFRPDAISAASSFPIVIIANAQNNQNLSPAQIEAGTNIEGNLDAQNVISVSYPTKFTALSTGGSPPFKPDLNTPTNTNEPYLTFLNYALAQDSLPQVISTSYGDDEQTVPESYANRVCSSFAQLGARGISVFFSSGDSGVGAVRTCFSNDGKNTRMFQPAFPAGCPWVTTVGGTKNFQPEVAVSRFGSGAGFSNYFGAPAYQADTVSAYIDSLDGKYDGLYNKSGRGYPDVAAQSNHDVIVWAGNITTVGGTSASSPTFAAVIALVNDALLSKGKPTLGFLNPWIYGGAYKALTDVTKGSSIGCGTAGFPAKEGWDAVTGWGTPNFKKLVDAAFERYPGGYPW